MHLRSLPLALPLAGAASLAIAACHTDTPEDITLRVALVAGDDAPAASGPLHVRRVAPNGESAALGTIAAGATSLELPPARVLLGDVVEVTDREPPDGSRLRGRSIPVVPSMLQEGTVRVLVGRAGAFTRAPGALDAAGAGFTSGLALERYAAFAGARAADVSLYDLAAWRPVPGQPPLPLAPRTMAGTGAELLLVGEPGAAWLHLTDDTVPWEPAGAPTGLAWSEIAGGATLRSPEGAVFVVGATRAAGAPTDKVLWIATDDTLRVLTLRTPRLGAAATWIPDVGLVVAGGAQTGAGVELGTGTGFVPLPYAADPTTGGALAALDGSHVLLVGGVSSVDGAPEPPRTFDLGCTIACAPEATATASLELRRATALASNGAVVAVGEDADGVTHAAWAKDALGAFAEVPLRDPRKGAVTLATGGGTLVVAAGVHADGTPALGVEVFAF